MSGSTTVSRTPVARPGARTPGARRAGPGEHYFDLSQVAEVHGGPAYTTATGPCVEGDRLIVALMRMPAGTGADAHSHPNEQWLYVLQGTLKAMIGGLDYEAKPGALLYIPPNIIHSVKATPDSDGVFFTAKDASHGLQGVKAG